MELLCLKTPNNNLLGRNTHIYQHAKSAERIILVNVGKEPMFATNVVKKDIMLNDVQLTFL